MSDVGVVFKIYAKDGEFDKCMAEVKGLGPKGMSSSEIGFGIKVIKAYFTFNNDSMTSSQIEEKIRKLQSVSEIEVEEESLI